MNLNRIDLYLIALLFIQFQLLFEAVRNLSFSTLQTLIMSPSVFSASEIALFVCTVIFSLKGIQKAVDSFFSTGDEQAAGAKGAGQALLITGFLLVTFIIVSRTLNIY